MPSPDDAHSRFIRLLVDHVACSYCGAGKGEWCHAKGGGRATYCHVDRERCEAGRALREAWRIGWDAACWCYGIGPKKPIL
jgi:hypothetical protein